MKELHDIIKELERKQNQHQSQFLATVVNVNGSTYRRPGARMLMTAEGKMIGTLSGGCLEADVWEHAKKLTDGQKRLLKYDMTADDDIIWGLGLGCKGIVEVLIEHLPGNGIPQYIQFLRQCLQTANKCVLATVFRTAGNANVEVGERLTFTQENVCRDTIANLELKKAMEQDVSQIFSAQRSLIKSYKLEEAAVDVLLEPIQAVSIVVFGAGQASVPVVSLAKQLGWQVTVVDARPAYANREHFPQADSIVVCQPEMLDRHIPLLPSTLALIMSHNYIQDLKLLQVLIPSPVCYIGILGSKNRCQNLLQELEQNACLTPAQLERIYSPIGLDIGAESPEEIAVAIIAEIQAVLKQRNGGFLKNRKGAIH